MDLKEIRKIYFIGIGGIGMSAVAGIAAHAGFLVSGSDSTDIYEPARGVLDHFKIKYVVGFDAKNLPADSDLVIASSGVDLSNPEMAKAIELSKRIVSFAELLDALAAGKDQIVVVGTNGKGTTAGLLSRVLRETDKSSFFVGGVLNDYATNFFVGSGKYFVIEGDEYKSLHNDLTPKFQHFNPSMLLINNIEHDHPDIYPTLQDVKNAFKKLLAKLSPEAVVIYNADDANVLEVVAGIPNKKIGFGFESAAADVKGSPPILKNGFSEITVKFADETQHFSTQFPGMIYAYNNLAGVTVLLHLGYKLSDVGEYIKSYHGIMRRYEIVYDDIYTIIDDYAHLASAVRQTLDATRSKYPNRRIIAFFEPHTFSRTKATLDQISTAFGSADVAFISEVYPAREQKLPSSISGEEVVTEVEKHHAHAIFVRDKTDALQKYSEIMEPGDVVVVMAVGSFNTLVGDIKKLVETERE